MKVLLTTHQFFPRFTSGTEVLTLSVAKDLVRRGHRVLVFTGHPTENNLADDKRFDMYDQEGIPVHRFHHAYSPMGGQNSMIEVGYDNHLAAEYFEQLLRNFQPDVIHFFHLNRLGTRVIEKAVEMGIPAFMTVTDFWTICPTAQMLLPDGKFCYGPTQHSSNCVKHFAQSTRKGFLSVAAKWAPLFLVDSLTRLALLDSSPSLPALEEVKAINARLRVNISRLNLLNRILSPNAMMYDLLIKYGVRENLLTQTTFGVDVVLADSKKSPRPKGAPFVIGYIGTLAPHKGCHILIEGFNALPSGTAILRIYGDATEFPEYTSKLESQAAISTGIEFRGTFKYSDIADVMAGLDVLVVPSVWHENTPLVIYSALACRCPLVVSDLIGTKEVVTHGKNGLLFEPGNAAALAQQLLRLLREPMLAASLADNAEPPKSTSTYVTELLALWRAECEINKCRSA